MKFRGILSEKGIVLEGRDILLFAIWRVLSDKKEQHEFMESVATESFEKTVNRYLRPIRDWKRLIYYKSPSFLRNIAKKFGR